MAENERQAIIDAHARWVEKDFLTAQEFRDHYQSGLEKIEINKEELGYFVFRLAVNLADNILLAKAEMEREFTKLLFGSKLLDRSHKIGFFSEYFAELKLAMEKIEAIGDYDNNIKTVIGSIMMIIEKYRQKMPQIVSPLKINSVIADARGVKETNLTSRPAKAVVYKLTAL